MKWFYYIDNCFGYVFSENQCKNIFPMNSIKFHQIISIFNRKHNLNFVFFIQPEFKAAVKRSADQIFERGGFIRKIDYLGFNKLPYKISKNRMPYREAEQIVFKFDVSSQLTKDLNEEIDLDVDVVRCKIINLPEQKEFKCTMEEEMQPVSYREDVKKLLKLQEKGKKKHWLPQMGIEYYPFQR